MEGNEMTLIIRSTAPDSMDATALIQELDQVLAPLYAVESRHGYSVQKLIDQQVLFFVLYIAERAAACAGIQFCADGDGKYGELKRMYVRPQFRGQGLAKRLLGHLEEVVRTEGVSLMRLETGIYQTAAIQLYEQEGYRRIPPFGDYFDDPVSLCYEKKL